MNIEVESKIIELQFDIVPIKENVIAYDTVNGYDNFHINYNVNKKDFRKNKDNILNEICYNILYNYSIPDEVKEADVILILDRKTRRILKIINYGYVKKSELEELRTIYNIDYLQFRISRLLGDEEDD